MSNHLYLAHHGIKGMKWGVRRFQNPDGTLTEAGKQRYKLDSDGSLQKLTRKERAAAKKERVEAARKQTMEDYVAGKKLKPTSRMYARSQFESLKEASKDEYIKSEEGAKLYKEWSDAANEYQKLRGMAAAASVYGVGISSGYFDARAYQVKHGPLADASRKLAQAEGHYTAAKIIDKYGENGLERFMNDIWYMEKRNSGEEIVDWYVRNNQMYWSNERHL